jgi:hypothetical protein
MRARIKPAKRAAAFRYSPFDHHRDCANGCRQLRGLQ